MELSGDDSKIEELVLGCAEEILKFLNNNLDKKWSMIVTLAALQTIVHSLEGMRDQRDIENYIERGERR